MNAPAFNSPTIAAADTLPASWYRAPGCWGVERSEIFARSWQFFAHESQLPEPGAWVAETIADYPLLVVRDEGGALRGFHNLCRHRAGPLTKGPSGRCDPALTCQYHGWTYALDGRLKAARDFGPSPGFDPRQFSLIPTRVETWRGLVFVCLDPEISPLSDWVAPLEQRLADEDWSELRVAARQTHALNCNWKTYVENYLEGYHVPVLHPGIDAEIESARYTVEMDARVAIHHAPPRPRQGDESGVYQGLWGWVWPNLGVNVYARGVMIERMSPVGAARTRLDYLYLMPDEEGVSEQTLAMADQVIGEDRWVVERVQENLDAGIYQTGRLSPRHEGAVAAFQSFVRSAVGEAPA